MGIQDRLRAMVIKNLSPKGAGVAMTLTKTTGSVFNPGTSSVTPGTTTNYLGSGLRVNYKAYEYKNTAIEYGDFQVYLSPVLLDGTDCPRPATGDKVIIGAESATVVNLERWNSNELECGYKLQMRN